MTPPPLICIGGLTSLVDDICGLGGTEASFTGLCASSSDWIRSMSVIAVGISVVFTLSELTWCAGSSSWYSESMSLMSG